jgi:hypothetical protein
MKLMEQSSDFIPTAVGGDPCSIMAVVAGLDLAIHIVG